MNALAKGPVVAWDWSMPDNIGELAGNQPAIPEANFPGVDLTGKNVPANPMSADPDYPEAGNALYGTVSGKHSVNLTACKSVTQGPATYRWNSPKGSRSSPCR